MWDRVVRPTTIDEALEVLAHAPTGTRIVAGGTDVLVELQRGAGAQTLVDVSGLRDLKAVRLDGTTVVIGGLATHNDLLAAPFAREAALPLAQACIEVGAPQIRTRATIAGNLITASPANDTIAPLLALDAEITLLSAAGERTLPLAEFYTGLRETVLRPDELVRAMRFDSLHARRRGVFIKLGLRRAQAISVVNVAIVLAHDAAGVVRDARITIGCVAPTVVRAVSAERALVGQSLSADACAAAGRAAVDDIAPIDDLRGGAAYRRTTVAALVTRALERLARGREADGVPLLPVLLETRTAHTSARAFSGTVDVRINGVATSLERVERKTLLNALRDDAGLIGAKEGCAEGECGACTVWLDGAAVMSCLVPATQAHGAEVTTIEGLARGDELHPLQEAYIACGAVQCGFCIPGMIMAGAKLLDERRAPSLDDHVAAISGNLCRCTGYRKILDAMTVAAREDSAYEPLPHAVVA